MDDGKSVNVHSTISRGIAYLRNSQREDGSFYDFGSTKNPATVWITAHVCWVLESLPEARDITARAVKYLAKHRQRNGSWGYNDLMVGDCSTTAQVLLVFQGHGEQISRKSIDWLLSQQASEGGFPTYPPSPNLPLHSWSRAHDDSTLEVIGAIFRLGVGRSNLKRAKSWILKRIENDMTKAFWWKGDSYCLWVQKKVKIVGFDNAIKKSAQRIQQGSNDVPDLPHYLFGLSSQKKRKFREFQAIHTLASMQHHDGSWRCSPCLRVPPGYCNEKVSNENWTFEGENRIFSTVHSISTLHEFTNKGQF